MIAFDLLVDELEKKEGQPFVFPEYKDMFIIYFQPICTKIEDVENRRKATLELMRVVIKLQTNSSLREIEKDLNYIAYTDNPKRKINARIKAVDTILSSLEHSTTKSAGQLEELLYLYKEQTQKLYNNEFDDIFWSKNYRLKDIPTKKPLKECLDIVIKEYNLNIDTVTIKQAIDNTPLSIH